MTRSLSVLLILFVSSCVLPQDNQHDLPEYSFFVAGHVYGYPGESEANIGVHPPFKENLDLIKNDTNIKFGVLTGDMVYSGTKIKEWEELDVDITYMDKKVYFAPGNHDTGHSKSRAVFVERYGPTYQSFSKNDDLFLIIDPNLNAWNISGAQLDWLTEELKTKATSSNNIFVFFHQILWWKKDNIYKGFKPNSLSGRALEINFFNEILPLFSAIPNPVFMFAGDTGVYEQGYMYHKINNVAFIASGMGGRKQDNFIIARVFKDKSVKFELISLNGDTFDALGNLEDYELPKN